jgi:hypothetical protein
LRHVPNTGGSHATRRTVLQSASVLAAGLMPGPAAAGARDETLALSGGPPAVTVPERQHAEASRWPIFGPEEEAAVLGVLRNPTYGPKPSEAVTGCHLTATREALGAWGERNACRQEPRTFPASAIFGKVPGLMPRETRGFTTSAERPRAPFSGKFPDGGS